MIHINDTLREFYRQLGKVFYGVAAADRSIRNEEKETLRNLVKENWLLLEDSEDEFGTDTAYQIEMSFDWFLENGTDQKTILQDFQVFKESHEKLFDSKVKFLAMKTVNSIAGSYSGKNKSELVYIRQLESILMNK